MRPLFYCFILLLFCHCGRQTLLADAAFPNLSTQQLTLSIDSFSIPNAVFDSVDFNFLQAKVLRDSLYLFVLNKKTRKMEVYNLDNLTKSWELRYDNLLDSFHNNQHLWSVYFHNLDTVVLHSEFTVVLINQQKVIYQRIINNPEALENIPYSLASQQMRTIWDSEKRGFWVQGYCSVCSQKAGDRYYKTPIEVFLPADTTQKWDTIPVTYPD